MRYVLDTNTISDYLEYHPEVTRHFEKHLARNELLILCQPVNYELQKGLLWRHNQKKLRLLQETILVHLTPETLTDADWLQAAQFWAQARRAGKQLSDIDCLIAALTVRLAATLASRDTDFDALPVTCVNWRSA